jgi:hypothetical protein
VEGDLTPGRARPVLLLLFVLVVLALLSRRLPGLRPAAVLAGRGAA